MSNSKSVVLSCAGIGSRLGLATTKALISIHGRSLVSWQLEMLKDVEDIRIVVGYEADEVIREVLKYRKDVIFVYNHNYFETKTGTSFYLGARHANEYVIELDGDLLVHPHDMQTLLEMEGEFAAYADVMSDDAVFLRINEHGDVVSFSRECGDYEWTGPACIQKYKLNGASSGHVFHQLEPWLPIKGVKIRACDIDTYDDYERALKFMESWEY